MLIDKNADMVDVRKVCPAIHIELRYTTRRNGVGRVIYPRGARCLLRRSVAERLVRVQDRLALKGVGLKVWDGYRPLSAQRALWAVCPNPKFVAPPIRGSIHNRGAAVDVTIVNRVGRELAMPTDFDAFGIRDLLQEAMKLEGFLPDANEWWHFSDPDWRHYPLTNVSLTPAGHRRLRQGHTSDHTRIR